MRHLSRDAHVTHTGISAHPKGVGKTPGKVVLSAPTHIRRFATCTRCRSQDFRWTGGASGRHGPEGRRSVRGESGAPPSFAFDGLGSTLPRVVIALISDTHLPRGRRRLPDACVERIRAADLLLHAGDIATPEVLEEIEAIGPPVRAVYGNVDSAMLRERLPEA